MAHRPTGVVFPALAAVLVLTPIAAPGKQARPIKPRFLAEVKGIQADTQALSDAWYRFLPRLQHGKKSEALPPPLVLKISLPRALYGKDLHLESYRIEGEWLPGKAWAPAWNRAVHVADTSRLQISGSFTKGNLTGRLHVRLLSDGWLPANGKPIDCIFQVNAHIRDNTLKEKFSTWGDEEHPVPIPKVHGELRGSISQVKMPLSGPKELPVQNIDGYTVFDLYAFARRAEPKATELYQAIRAIEIARTVGLSYRKAREEAPVYVPVIPDYDPADVAKKKKAAKSAPKIDKLDIGDEEDDDLLGDDDKGEPERDTGPTENDPRAQQALRTLRAMRSRVAAMRQTVERREKAGTDRPEWQTDGRVVSDPDFGPWYGLQVLPYDAKTGRHTIPENAGGEGLQKWPCVGTWRIIGPLRLPRWDVDTPLMPEMPFDFAAKYPVQKDKLKRQSYKGPRLLEWKETGASRPFGYIVPPNWASNNRVAAGCSRAITDRHSGMEYSSFYAYTEIISPRNMELWTGLGVQQRAKIWLNEEFFWAGPTEVDESASQHVFLLKIPFRKGVNRLMMRVDVDYASPSVWMRICTHGKPRDAKTIEAQSAAVAAARKKISPPNVSGYRGDYTGNFPDATPPVAWHYRKKINVLWHTPLRYWSNASVALAEDRLFTGIEPHWLACLSKTDGRVLWEHPVTTLDLIEDEEARQEGWRLYNAWWKAREERDAIPNYIMPPEKWLRHSWYWSDGTGIWAPGKKVDEREGASPELVALFDKRDELEKAPDPNEVQEELTKVLKEIEELKTKAAGDNKNSPQAKAARVGTAERAFIGFMRKHSYASGLEGYWQDYDGYAFATPTTDGKHVWWKNGMGSLACFDMDGNLKWHIKAYCGGSGSRVVSSPVLVDGKVIVKSVNYLKIIGNPWEGNFMRKGAGIRLSAYDALTGETLWEAKNLPTYGWNWNANTPAPVTLTNGKDFMKVLVTAGGAIVRVADGKVLAYNIGADSTDASVLPLGDIVIFPRPHMVAYRLIMVSRDVVGFKRIWSHQLGSHGIGYHGCIADPEYGLLYHETGFGHYYRRWSSQTESGPGEDRIWCIVKDLFAGREVKQVDMHRKGGNYWSLNSVSRDYVWMLGGDGIFRGGIKPPSHLTVMTRGCDPIVVARNAVERTYGGPTFEGDRMYIRGYRGVTCVGYTGDEGRRYEARITAESVLDLVHPDPPRNTPPLVPATVKARNLDRSVYPPVSRVEHNRSPHSWLFAGPFPITSADAVLKSFGGPAARLKVGDKARQNGTAKQFVLMNQANVKAPGIVNWEHEPANMTLQNKHRRIFVLHKILHGKAGTVSYLYAELKSDKRQTMRWEQTTPGVRAWISGKEIKHGDRIDFAEGLYTILLQVKAAEIPEAGLFLAPRFRRSEDAAKERTEWMSFVKKYRSYLDNVVKLAPDSPEARRARIALSAL